MSLAQSELGKKSDYKTEYDSSLLFPIGRSIKRDELGIKGKPSFFGSDIWTAFEVSWLNLKGKPNVRIAVVEIDAYSECIIESKSFKLYLNSFNNSRFESEQKVFELIEKDVVKACCGKAKITFYNVTDYQFPNSAIFNAQSLDGLDVEITDYITNKDYLTSNPSTIVSEKLSSDLLKSNCLVTLQPDWGSVLVQYQGPKIDHEGLLKYLVSFRNHNEFHEQCVERIYMDIMEKCRPEKLLVYARYTRRGGLDINPIRTNFRSDEPLSTLRLARQ